jgi:CDP-glucose 4,6-dehydratase
MNRLHRAYKGKKVLITGHTGFKGSWLSEWLLLLGAEVTGYALEPQEADGAFERLGLSSRLKHYSGDVRDCKGFYSVLHSDAFDAVFHLAAQPLVRESYRQPLETCETNIMGTCRLLEAARSFTHPCALVVVTTDKCYDNLERPLAYSETDPLGGRDLYSASKAAVELVTHAYRCSFFSDSLVRVATARAGNVIGGGDVAQDRIFPDAIRAFRNGQTMRIRNPASTRPWQHVLEPLSGYLWLGARLGQTSSDDADLCGAFNFGPLPESNKSVQELVLEVSRHFPLKFVAETAGDKRVFHEAGLLNLSSAKAKACLGWKPVWNFSQAVEHSAVWYREVDRGESALEATRRDLAAYEASARSVGLDWSLEA